MSALWGAAGGEDHIRPLRGALWRMVMGQDHLATRALVDTLDEHAVLEAILEDGDAGPPRGLHALLGEPFRRPPLPHGSRFGTRFEPSLFYAARDRGALGAEVAYYRLLFLAGPAQSFPEPLRTRHTAFSVAVEATRAVRLEAPPFTGDRQTIRDPQDYRATQALGAAMRGTGVQAFTYPSARHPDGLRNAALFTPQAFARPAPVAQESWLCEVDHSGVVLRGELPGDLVRWERQMFEVDGALPSPAT